MKNKKTVIAIISIVAVLLVIIGVTYAYWLVTKTQTNQNVISSGCLDISLTDEKNAITLIDQFPLSDEDGMKLTPYEFIVTNNCTTSVDYHINLESIGDSATAIKASALKVVLNENKPKKLYEYVGAEPTISEAYDSYSLLYGRLAASGTTGSTTAYKLRIWIDKDAPISEQNKTFASKITVSVGQHISSQGNTLASLILDHAEENNYLYSTTPNFANGTTADEYGVYKTQDDLGDSYYFRGNPNNNYVKFGETKSFPYEIVWEYYTFEPSFEMFGSGKINTSYTTEEECLNSPEIAELRDQYNEYTLDAWCEQSYNSIQAPMYWRIIRINGDGTVRLVYDGIKSIANGTVHDPYAGTYLTNGDAKISYSLDFLYDWYEDNLNETYAKYIADGIFCSDREISKTVTVDGNNPNDTYEYFAAYTRTIENDTPKLTCKNKQDRYTVSSSIGNGLSKNPIGLITADEVMMAGGMRFMPNNNQKYYLDYLKDSFWTMSPAYYYIDYGETDNIIGTPVGNGNTGIAILNIWLTDWAVHIPVVNIKADVLFKGDGTTTSPYVIAN